MGEQGALARRAHTVYAATLNEAQQGMAEMSEKFKAMGDEVYVDAAAVRESNRAL